MKIEKVHLNCDCTPQMVLNAIQQMIVRPDGSHMDVNTESIMLLGRMDDSLELKKVSDEMNLGGVCLLPNDAVPMFWWAICRDGVTIWSPGA